jgi:hypothetical protein
MGGTIKINANDTVRQSIIEAKLSCFCDRNPYIDLSNIDSRQTGCIEKIRLSTDGTDIKLDIYCPNASTYPVAFSVDFEGFFTVITPVINSTPLTKCTTNSVNNKDIKSTNFVATSNDWYSIATEKTSTGYCVAGKIQIECRDSIGYSIFEVVFQGNQSNISTPVIVNKSMITRSPITQVRISRDSSHVKLDVYCATAASQNATINIIYGEFGEYTRILNPVGGSTALTTESLTASV